MKKSISAYANFPKIAFTVLAVVPLLLWTSTSSAQAQANSGWYVRGSAAALVEDSLSRLTQGNPASGIPSVLYSQTPNFSSQNTSAFSLALGRNMTPEIRGEVELHFANAKFATDTFNGNGGRTVDTFNLSGNTKSISFLLNGIYDFGSNGLWKPYLKAGVGATQHRSDANLVATINAFGITSPTPNAFPAGKRSTFTWSFGAGTAYPINEATSLELGYRYIDMGTAKTGTDSYGDSINSKMRAHELSVGISYKF